MKGEGRAPQVVMKGSLFVALSLGAVALASPKLQRRAACTSNVTLGSGNAFASRKLHANIYYRAEVEAAAAAASDSSLKAQILKSLMSVPSSGCESRFHLWFSGSSYQIDRDTIDRLKLLDDALKQTACDEIFGLVVYDLPGRDCAAKASNGELPVGLRRPV